MNEKIKSFGIIKYKYDNEATNYISNFIDYDNNFYGIYFMKNKIYYTISFNFFDNNIAYFTNKVFILDLLINIIPEIHFYPQDKQNFLLFSNSIIKKALNYSKDNFANYNFGKYVINKILNKVLNCKVESDIDVNDCFKYLFKIPNIIDKNLFDSVEKKINFKFQECLISDNPTHIIKNENFIVLDHSNKKNELFNTFNNLFLVDRDKYDKLIVNYFTNKNKFNFAKIKESIDDTDKHVDKINKGINRGFIESVDIKNLINGINKILSSLNYNKLEIHECDLFSYNKDKIKISDLEIENYDLIILDNSNIENNEKRFYTKNINENKSINQLKDLLKYINSIHKSFPYDKQLIGIQNELIKKILEFEKN